MFTAPSEIPIVHGIILNHFRTSLSDWLIVCQEERPTTMPQRLLTLRDDSGPIGLTSALLRHGVNIWADSKLDSREIARDAMAAVWQLPGVGPLRGVTEMTGATLVPDDPAYVYDSKPLHHYFFSFVVLVKARTP